MRPTFTDALIHWKRANNLGSAQIGRMFGYHESLISMYLNRKRKITLPFVQDVYVMLPNRNPLKEVARQALLREILL